MRALTAALLIAMTPAAAHAAPMIAVDKPCYRTNTEVDSTIHLTGSGFTPGAEMVAQLGEESRWLDRADADGRINGYLGTSSIFDPGEVVLRVYERERPEVAAEVPVRLALWDMIVPSRPSLVAPRRRFRFVFTGWPAGSTIYAHYLHRGKRRVATRRVTGITDSCQSVALRRRHIPVDVVRTGGWEVWYSTSPTQPRQAPSMMEFVDVTLLDGYLRRHHRSRIGLHPYGRKLAHRD